MKIAVVGGGVAGLGTAWLLARAHEVTLYESADYLGGHSNTVTVDIDGGSVPVDTGFIVYNEHTYPNLTQLFARLGVETVASDMSFGVSLDDGQMEYSSSAPGLVAQPCNLFRRHYWKLIAEMLRFYREAPGLAVRTDLDDRTLGDLLSELGYSADFARQHVLPMAAAIWSSKMTDILDFPARTFVEFFDNHGLFKMVRRPQWRSVKDGSQRYVEALSASFRDRVRLSTPVRTLRRTPAGVLLRDGRGHEDRFDQVIIAAHADQALGILGAGATEEERAVLGAFRYEENRAVLHRDPRLMPRRRRAWASWSYLAETGAKTDGETCQRVSVSYWMNRLQRLETDRDVFVTLNPLQEPEPDLHHAAFIYHHPQFDRQALQAQDHLPSIQGQDRVWFCGSYCGYGFHEDALQSGFAVAAALGAPAPWANSVVPMSPAWRAALPAAPALAAE